MNALQLEYNQDFYSWIYKNIDLLKQRKFSEIDVDILIDELESMTKYEKRELSNYFMVLIANLLKWQFQPEQRGGSWRGSIHEQRIKITKQLEDSPSLKNNIEESISKSYSKSVALAAKELDLPLTWFPERCPYSIDQLLNEDFYPFES
jgi:hypothetical protein